MNPETESLYKQAESAEQSRDFEKALECYQHILEKESSEDHAYYGAANAYAVRGLVPQVVTQYLNLVDVLEGKAQLEGALEVCQWVISIEPHNTQARLKLIDILEKQSNKKEAIKQSLILSRIFSTLGHGEQSIALLQRLQELDPENPDLALQLGEIYIKQGQISEGLALYKTIAQELIKLHEYAKALEVLKRIKVIKFNDLENLSSLGHLYVETGKLEEAKAEFRQILRQNLNSIDALLQLGLIAKMQGRWEEARVPFRKIVELDPENPAGRESFGEVNESMGNPVEASRNYLVAAEIYEKTGTPEKAVELYQNVLAVDSENDVAKSRLEALGAPIVSKKKIIESPASRPPVVAPAGTVEIDSTQPQVVEESVAEHKEVVQASNAMLGSNEQLKPEESAQKRGLISKGLLKPGVKSGKSFTPPGSILGRPTPPSPPVEGETVSPSGKGPLPSGEQSELPSGVTPPGAVPRTRPASKPILTRKRDTIPARVSEPTKQPSREQQPISQSLQPAPSVAASSDLVASEPPVTMSTPPTEEPIVAQAVAQNIAPAQEPAEQPVVEMKPSVPEQVLVYEASGSDTAPELSQLISQGRGGAAIQWCMQSLKDTPQDRKLKETLAQLYFKYNMLGEALPLLTDLLRDRYDRKLASLLADTYLLLNKEEQWVKVILAASKEEFSLGNFKGAAECANKILALDSSNIPARQMFVASLQEQKLIPLAIYHQTLLVEALETSNQVEQLIPAYEQFLKWKPDNANVRFKLALCYQEVGSTKEAKSEFLKLADQYASSGNEEKQTDTLKRIFALDPTDEVVLQKLREVYSATGSKDAAQDVELKLADLYSKSGRLESAIEIYQRILTDFPEQELALSNLVALYGKEGKANEQLPLGHRLAEFYLKQERVDEAISVYKNLLEAHADNMDLHRELASLYSKHGKSSEAILEYMTLAYLASNNALFDEAIHAYKQVLFLDSSYKDARYQLGVIFADHKNDWPSALAEFKKVKNLDPEHNATLSRLAKGYIAHGEIENALIYVRMLQASDQANLVLLEDLEKDVESQVKKEPDNYKNHFNLGLVYRELGKLDEAIREFQSVARKSSELALRAYAYQGLCWEDKGVRENEESLYQTAIKVYRKGLETKGYKEEEYLELKYRLARCYELTEKITEAIAVYQEIITVDLEYEDSRSRKIQLEEELSSGKVTRLSQNRRQESGS